MWMLSLQQYFLDVEIRIDSRMETGEASSQNKNSNFLTLVSKPAVILMLGLGEQDCATA
jgi:hypothetical protein